MSRRRPERTSVRLTPAEKQEMRDLAKLHEVGTADVIRAGIALVRRYGLGNYLIQEEPPHATRR